MFSQKTTVGKWCKVYFHLMYFYLLLWDSCQLRIYPRLWLSSKLNKNKSPFNVLDKICNISYALSVSFRGMFSHVINSFCLMFWYLLLVDCVKGLLVISHDQSSYLWCCDWHHSRLCLVCCCAVCFHANLSSHSIMVINCNVKQTLIR